MGRRNRRNKRHRSDSDDDDDNAFPGGQSLSLEEMFERRQNDDTEKDDEKASHVGASADSPCAKKQKIESLPSDDRIASLQRKKQERKQRQKEKKLARQQQAEAAKKTLERQAQHRHTAKQQEQSKKLALQQSSKHQFTTLRKGVQMLDVLVGKGPTVQDRKRVVVKYKLHAKNRYGKVIDSADAFSFRLGRGEVIEGWDIGLQGMRQGGIRQLIVPPLAGYGLRKNVGAGVGGTLFFQVEVLRC